jgi:hypothetical protein
MRRAARRRLRSSATSLLLGAAVVALGVAWPLSTSLRHAGLAPVPPLVPGVVDVLVSIIEVLRDSCPYVALGGLVALVAYTVAGHWSPRARVLNRLARIDYAGVDHLGPRAAGTRRGRAADAVRRRLSGSVLACLAILLVGAMSGVEHEITEGPLRPVDEVVELVSPGPTTLVLQSPALTFMDDSAIPAQSLADTFAHAPYRVTPFGKYLFNIDDRSALEISLPDAVYARLTGRPAARGCADGTIVVDDTVGAPVGSTVSVNGERLRVVRVLPGIAQMNRSIAVMADSTARACIGGGSTTYFGAIAATGDAHRVRQAITSSRLPGMVAVRGAAFKENNRDFWRANATPLVLQVIFYLMLFGGFAAAGERQSLLQRNSREIGMLHAAGVDFRSLRAVEYRRALRLTFTGAAVAAPLMVPIAAAFNASELGIHISVGLTEVSVGVALTLVTMLVSSHRSLRQFRRSLDLPLAVKG